ncbi:MAG: L,D-transpeptidase/peptidoglycan binding protein [Micrococcales bacterium]|nr:L,D-transpeptidase/peptidoglycan binding protein [Micrococcales bacterium]
MKKRTLVLVMAGGVGLVLLQVAIVAGAVYAAHFNGRGLPGTTVAGESISGKTRAQVTADLVQRAAATTITWTSPGAQPQTVTLAELGLTVDVQATVDEAFSRNSTVGGQVSALFVRDRVDAVITSDGKTLQATALQIAVDAGVAGSDARVAVAEDGTTFEVVPAVFGKVVDPATFDDVVHSASADLTARSTTIEFVDGDPLVTDEAAHKGLAEANALMELSVVVSDGDKDHSPDPKTQATWVTFPVTAAGLGAATLDINQVTAWVQKLADDVRTDPVVGKRWVNPKGEVLSEIRKPVDGEEVTNVETVSQTIIDHADAGKDYTGQFEYTTVPAVWQTDEADSLADVLAYLPDPGEKWIDVNLTNHTVTLFEGPNVVMGPYSMVDGARVTPTVTGLFAIYLKYESKTMRGFEADGVTPYVTENVPWAMFFHGGYALHGAYWRSTFGYSASHGCINLPVSTAKQVYQWAPIGTVVAVHR